jgi:hypothetical protein
MKRILLSEILEGKDHLRDLDVDGRTILKLTLKRRGVSE